MKRKSEHLIRTGLILVMVAFLAWAYVAGSFQYMLEHPDELLHLIIQHLQLVGLSTLLAVAIALPFSHGKARVPGPNGSAPALQKVCQ